MPALTTEPAASRPSLQQASVVAASGSRPANPADSTPAPSQDLFRPGSNCWRVCRANRIAVLTDGAAYFSALKLALRNARRSILFLAWDFNSQMPMYDEHDEATACDERVTLGNFLNALVKRRRGLHVHILVWDYPMIFGTDREFPPRYRLGWTPHRRVHLHYDNTQPVGASHHQKIVVIDDAMAFCGGLDPTCRRWDTCDHKAEQPLRTVDGKPYPPFHDHMMAVDGEAARALGDLARERWLRSLGKRLRSITVGPEVWPESVQPQLSDVNIAISRTEPLYNEQPGANEVETLYLDMIATARNYIYIENQYFTANSVGDAIEASLKQPQGPEIVVVLRLLSHGWLEEMTMQMLRTKLIRRLREADRHGRFHVYYPHITGLADGTCIDVHAKMILIDDEWLRIGSANLANRSMGMDTECDLTVAAGGDPLKQATLKKLRVQLLAEHLGREPAEIEHAFSREMSAAQIIEQLKQPDRALLELPDTEVSSSVMALAAAADPEKPAAVDQFLNQFSPLGVNQKPGNWLLRIAGTVLAIIALTTLWEYTPLTQLTSPARIADWADEVSGSPIAWLVVLLAYTPACVVMFPRTLITLFAVVAFGPIAGFALAMTGILIAATLTYVAGCLLPRETVLRLTRGRLDRLAQSLRSRGLMAVIALRLVPVAPFVVEGIVAGAIRIKLWHFELGTALGMLPGTLAATIFGDQLVEVLHDPHHLNYPWIAAAVLLIVAAGVGMRRWFSSVYATRRAVTAQGALPG